MFVVLELAVGEVARREGGFFQVDVLDNGQGADTDDMILLTAPDADACSEPEVPTMQLRRGNVKVHEEAPKAQAHN